MPKTHPANSRLDPGLRHLKRQLIEVGRLIYERKYTTATDGNLSARTTTGKIVITKSGVCKGRLTDADLLVCDLTEQAVGIPGISSEYRMHLAVYDNRSDLNAVIHTHPPFAVALSLAGITLDRDILPEVAMQFGDIPTARFAPPCSGMGAEAVAELIRDCNAMILDRHGVLTAGHDLWDTFYKLERLEFAAKVTWLARMTGALRKLTESESALIEEAAKNYLNKP